MFLCPVTFGNFSLIVQWRFFKLDWEIMVVEVRLDLSTAFRFCPVITNQKIFSFNWKCLKKKRMKMMKNWWVLPTQALSTSTITKQCSWLYLTRCYCLADSECLVQSKCWKEDAAIRVAIYLNKIIYWTVFDLNKLNSIKCFKSSITC